MANKIIQSARNSMGLILNQIGARNPFDQRENGTKNPRNLSRYPSPVQLARIKQDVQTWRDAMTEAENAWYPHRVKMQRMYLDTILNGHVFACMDARIKMTMLKNYKVVTPSGEVDEKTTALFKSGWFRKYMRYALESKGFGYSLVYLGDLIQDSFPQLSIVKRFNISPDRLNVTQFVYSISGVDFTQPPFADWHIWAPTPSDVGVSEVGYGYLYKVAFYEIIAKNVISQNTDATELFGMPLRVGKTNKAEESAERAIFEQALAEMGSAGYLLMDANGDSVELVESAKLGTGYKIYESLEQRCEKKISKIILGHADALDSVPGKLGGQDQEDSPVNRALDNTCTVDMNDLMDLTNDQLIPKLRNLGFNIPQGNKFIFDNNEELEEVREKEDDANTKTATIFQTIKNAGGDPDWNYFTERTGIPVVKSEIPEPLAPEGGKMEPGINPKVRAQLEKIYSFSKPL